MLAEFIKNVIRLFTLSMVTFFSILVGYAVLVSWWTEEAYSVTSDQYGEGLVEALFIGLIVMSMYAIIYKEIRRIGGN